MKAMIKAIRSFLPETKLTNQQLAEEFPDWEMEKTYQNTGVAERRIAAADECASDFAVKAAQLLFDSGIIGPKEIDFLLFCTQGPDYILPTTACIIQDRLGLPTTCGALDFNLGCSGFVYGIALAKTLIETRLATNVLFLVGDASTKSVNPRDRGVRALFSDGVSAVLITPDRDDEEELIGPFVFGTDGRGGKKSDYSGGWVPKPLYSSNQNRQR